MASRIRTGEVEFNTTSSSATSVTAEAEGGADQDCGLPADHEVMVWIVKPATAAVTVDLGAGKGRAIQVPAGGYFQLGESPNGHVYPRRITVYGTGNGTCRVAAQVAPCRPE